jgi:hypothetical protein
MSPVVPPAPVRICQCTCPTIPLVHAPAWDPHLNLFCSRLLTLSPWTTGSEYSNGKQFKMSSYWHGYWRVRQDQVARHRFGGSYMSPGAICWYTSHLSINRQDELWLGVSPISSLALQFSLSGVLNHQYRAGYLTSAQFHTIHSVIFGLKRQIVSAASRNADWRVFFACRLPLRDIYNYISA